MGVLCGTGGRGTLLVPAWLPKRACKDGAASRCPLSRGKRSERHATATSWSDRKKTAQKNRFAEAGTRGGQAFSSFVRKTHHRNGKGRATHETSKDANLSSRIAPARGLEPGTPGTCAPGSGSLSL